MKKTAWILALTITAALLAACRPNPATPVDTSPETAETAVATVETDPVTAAVTDGPESSLPETQPGGISDPETAAPTRRAPKPRTPVKRRSRRPCRPSTRRITAFSPPETASSFRSPRRTAANT